MVTSFAEIMAAARKLPRKQRARLAREIYLSFVYRLEEIEFGPAEKVFWRARAHRRGILRRLKRSDHSGRRRSGATSQRSAAAQSLLPPRTIS